MAREAHDKSQTTSASPPLALSGQRATIPRTGKDCDDASRRNCGWVKAVPIEYCPLLTTSQIDYRSFLDKIWEAMPASEFIAMISAPSVLGNPLLRTQHFIGGTRWEKISDTEVIGHHQLRVPHQKYRDESMSEVVVKGHAHSYNKHWYRKIDGVWKFAGLAPDIRWSEYDFDQVFADGRENFGEEVSSETTKTGNVVVAHQEIAVAASV